MKRRIALFAALSLLASTMSGLTCFGEEAQQVQEAIETEETAAAQEAVLTEESAQAQESEQPDSEANAEDKANTGVSEKDNIRKDAEAWYGNS